LDRTKKNEGKGPIEFSEDRAHTHIGTNNMSTFEEKKLQPANTTQRKAERLIQEISLWIQRKYNLSKIPTEIAHEMLTKAIISVAGVHDRRSVNARVELLKANGLLKGIAEKLYQISYNITEPQPPAPRIERSIFREV
jgi:uncharacterized membrane-anchored protein